jgi:transcriptional regulator with XRE-family HTH domain
MSQEDLGDAMGVHWSSVSHWEKAVSVPRQSKLPKLAEILKTTIEDLISGERAFESLSQMLEAAAS